MSSYIHESPFTMLECHLGDVLGDGKHILETEFEEIHTEVIQQREDLRVDYNNVFNKFYSYYITDTSDFATEEAELEEL